MRVEGGRFVLMDGGPVCSFHLEQDRPAKDNLRTPLYMAPEQLRGEIVGPTSDLYSLGVLLYTAVSGELPVEGSTYAELIAKHERRDRVPLRDRRPDLPAGFIQVVERALEIDHDRRYSSAGSMEQALASTLGMRFDPPDKPVNGSHDKRPYWLRRPVLSFGVTLLILAGVVLGVRSGRIGSLGCERPPTDGTAPPVTPPSGAEHALAANAALYRATDSGPSFSEGARSRRATIFARL
jgi:serine/threonine protein kinase